METLTGILVGLLVWAAVLTLAWTVGRLLSVHNDPLNPVEAILSGGTVLFIGGVGLGFAYGLGRLVLHIIRSFQS